MSEAEVACCPACQAPVDLMRIASMSQYDRYICKNCRASLQRTSPEDQVTLGAVLLCVLIAQLLKLSLWLLLLFPLVFLARRARLKRLLPTTTFKLSEPWSLRS